MNVNPGMVFPFEGKWKFTVNVDGERIESILRASTAKQCMRCFVDWLENDV